MNLHPTDDGGLELTLEHPVEWMLLLSILADARDADFDLAASVGAAMDADEHGEDWRQWVLPDLREGFAGHVEVVATALEAGPGKGFSCPTVITIPKERFFDWYATINQARLALEAKYNFGPDPDLSADAPADHQAAYQRSRFYCFLQSHLLDLGLG